MSFIATLQQRWKEADSMLCVGLDPDVRRIPAHLGHGPAAIRRFCFDIIDATADLACAFKPQIAYFSAWGAEAQLEKLIAHIRSKAAHVPIILDAKRGDIGATAKQYAREAFVRYDADAVTLSPFMGFDSVEPYLEYPQKGVFLLCRTSNPGGDDFQSLRLSSIVGDPHLYQHLAFLAQGPWNINGQVGLVVGATYPAELANIREIAPTLPLLIPGVGAQGGDAIATVQASWAGPGSIAVNSSRAILYASEGPDFAEAARKAAEDTRDLLISALMPPPSLEDEPPGASQT